MNPTRLKKLLQKVASGEISVLEAERDLKNFAFEDIGFARVDHHRHVRCGFPEVIYCPGKTSRQIAEIARKIKATGSDVLATRLDRTSAQTIKKRNKNARYFPEAKILYIPAGRKKGPVTDKSARVVVCTAGTSDIPIAEEAALTAWAAGCSIERVYDAGVAGLHRLTASMDILNEARVIIVAAGMEGALASVVGGLVTCPVIAVPTSVGYGASFGGVAALLGMLNSCAPGVVVVNIDNGFGAGMAAAMIARNTR